MTLDPLLSAPLAVQLHVVTVIPAAFLGAYILAARKGTPRHKLLGRLWIFLMVVSALSSFFIHEIRLWGDFSPIHLISIWVMIASVLAIAAARGGNIRAHKRYVTGMYLGGIVGAGIFTFFPGRVMNRAFLSGYDFAAVPVAENVWPALPIAVLFFLAARTALRARFN